jgi:hypothetical protein
MPKIIKNIQNLLLENLSFTIFSSSFIIKNQLIATIFFLIILNLIKMSFNGIIFRKIKNILKFSTKKDEDEDDENKEIINIKKIDSKVVNKKVVNEKVINEKEVNEEIINEKEVNEKSNAIKNNIKLILTKIDKEETSRNIKIDPCIKNLEKQYNNYLENYDFTVNINSATCNIPIFNMRSYDELDFHYNFIIHDFDTKKINNLIMCKDINKWMSSPSLSNEDLKDELVPLYFIKKKDGKIEVYEYLKIFIYRDSNDSKTAFTQKGNDYLIIKDNIDKLIEKELIKDLLEDKDYTNYNLSNSSDVSVFLENLLSLFLINEKFVGDKLQIDIENIYDNKKTYDFHFHTLNTDCSMFNTSI